MLRVVHFEIAADDAARAVKFYQDVFGWKIQRAEGLPMEYYLAMTGEDAPGIDGAIYPRQAPFAGTVNSIDVPSVDEYVDKAVKAGGKVIAPKMAIPGVGWLAYLVDTEGNQFGIMERDESAR
ncbi:MAG: VOC family protein [Anaerolineae bacterium]